MIPTLGGFYQQTGYVDCFTKLGWTISSVLGPAAKLALLPRDAAEAIVETTIRLAERIASLPEPIREVSSSSERLPKLTQFVDAAVRKKIQP